MLSEEGKDDKLRLESDRVWIIDPVDGTREFSEPPRDDWAIHVALWQDGDLVAGAVAQPGLGQTFSTGEPPVVPARTSTRPRIAVSRTRPPEFVSLLAEAIGAVARAAGLHTSRADGAELEYNQVNVLLHDLLVCRSELAEQITRFVREYWVDNPPT